jgi:hypothetical protein
MNRHWAEAKLTSRQHALDKVHSVAEDKTVTLLGVAARLCGHGLDLDALQHRLLNFVRGVGVEDCSARYFSRSTRER